MKRSVAVISMAALVGLAAPFASAIATGSVWSAADAASQQSDGKMTSQTQSAVRTSIARTSIAPVGTLDISASLVAFRGEQGRTVNRAVALPVSPDSSVDDADGNWWVTLTGVVLVILVATRRSQRY